MESEKDTTARDATVGITSDCNNVLSFLQAVSLKAPQVLSAPLLLRVDKRASGWFLQWADCHIKQTFTHNNNAPQDHSGLTRVLSEAATHLQNSEYLRPVVAALRKAYREMRGWYQLPPEAQQVIPTESTVDGLTITLAPLSSINQFLNTRNATSLQSKCAMT